MASEPVEIPVPICEVCWLIDHTSWEPESVSSDGKVLMRLTGVDVPEKYNTESVEICAECGGITVAGIYELRDPATLYFLDDTEEGLEGLGYDDVTHFFIDLHGKSDNDKVDGDN
jgi:hypothetical protein